MFLCFVCIKTLQQACIVIAYSCLLLAVYHVTWSTYFLISSPHWIHYLTLVTSLLGIPFHAILLHGSRKEVRQPLLAWLVYTGVVTFPSCVLLLAVCILRVHIYCIFVSLLGLGLRVYMWFRVREFHELLVQGPAPQFNNPLGASPPPDYNSANVV